MALKEFDAGNTAFSGKIEDAEALVKFAQAESMPLVIEFNDANAPKIFGGGIKTHMLMFSKFSVRVRRGAGIVAMDQSGCEYDWRRKLVGMKLTNSQRCYRTRATRRWLRPCRRLLPITAAPSSSSSWTSKRRRTRGKRRNDGSRLVPFSLSPSTSHSVVEFFNIDEKDVPTLRLIKLEGEMSKFAPDFKELTAENIKQFAQSFVEGTLKVSVR